jgi:hypothetical protein
LKVLPEGGEQTDGTNERRNKQQEKEVITRPT